MKKQRLIRTNIYLTVKQHKLLRMQAAVRGVTMSAIVRDALEDTNYLKGNKGGDKS